MSDEKKHREELDDLTRRNFLVKLGLGSVTIAALGSSVFGYQYLSPNVLYEPSPIVDAGKPDQYPLDSVTLDPQTAIYIAHSTEGYYALSATCTHLGCLTAYKADQGIIACPCHGSKFKKDGTKIEGPAPKPLPWLRMWMSDDGTLMVDRSTQLGARQMVRV